MKFSYVAARVLLAKFRQRLRDNGRTRYKIQTTCSFMYVTYTVVGLSRSWQGVSTEYKMCWGRCVKKMFFNFNIFPWFWLLQVGSALVENLNDELDYDPQVAISCDKVTRHVDVNTGDWVVDKNSTRLCTTDNNEILKWESIWNWLYLYGYDRVLQTVFQMRNGVLTWRI